MRRVAITGVGAVTPLGNDAASTWDALVAGRSGVDFIRSFDADAFPVNIAAEVKDFDPGLAMSPKEVRRTASDVHFGVAAAMEAARDAGLVVDDPKRVGVVIGSVMGGLSYTLRQQTILEERGWERVSPHWLPNTLVDTTTQPRRDDARRARPELRHRVGLRNRHPRASARRPRRSSAARPT